MNATSPNDPWNKPPSRGVGVTETPAASAGTSSTPLPEPVSTTTANSLATGALAMRILVPLTTQLSPSFFAVVATGASVAASR